MRINFYKMGWTSLQIFGEKTSRLGKLFVQPLALRWWPSPNAGKQWEARHQHKSMNETCSYHTTSIVETTTRWFKVPFSSPSWRSLNPLKGSRFHHPKKVTLNHQAPNFSWDGLGPATPFPHWWNQRIPWRSTKVTNRKKVMIILPLFSGFWQGQGSTKKKRKLAGGNSNIFLFTRMFGEMIQFDGHIFQMGGSTTNRKTMHFWGEIPPLADLSSPLAWGGRIFHSLHELSFEKLKKRAPGFCWRRARPAAKSKQLPCWIKKESHFYNKNTWFGCFLFVLEDVRFFLKEAHDRRKVKLWGSSQLISGYNL